jgi:DNA-binding SARP family transcriptional activator/TolB-like protein
MSKLSKVSLRLLGPFAVEANLGRPIDISIRAKKARGLLAYLAMKPDYRVRREELATLLWGDSIDASARHSLRQCLISLRQDLSIASEALVVDRDAVGLKTQLVWVDARRFSSLARSRKPGELAEAAALWRDGFLPDMVLDVEEFDAWRMREADRLSGAAADVFEAICRNADAEPDGETALAAADRLIALDPTREDRQRIALKLLARYKGRAAALSRATWLADMLRREVDASPDAATRVLIAAIKRGDFESASPLDRERVAAEDVAGPAAVEEKPAALPPPGDSRQSSAAAPCLPVAPPGVALPGVALPGVALPGVALPAVGKTMPSLAAAWRRRPLAAAVAALAVAAAGSVALLGPGNWAKLSVLLSGAQQNRTVAVLPFVADDPASSDQPTFARALTHDLIGYLSRFGNLRVLSEPTSELYRSHQPDADAIGHLGARYALVGRVQGSGQVLKIDFQLVNTVTQTNVWSDALQHERSEPNGAADEAAREIARMLAIEVERLAVLQSGAKPNSQLTVPELIGRGYLAMQRGSTRENLFAAMKSFDEALRRNPHALAARLAVARVQIIAAMNFVDI